MSEKKTAIIRDLNKCLVFELGSDGKQPILTDGRNEAIAAFVYKNGKLQRVYNRAEHTLEVFELNFEFEASEQDISHYIGSYKRDYNPYTGEFDIEGGDVPYSGTYTLDGKEYAYDNGFTLPANAKDSSRSGYIKVLQSVSGLSFSCTYTQAARQLLGYSFKQILSVSVSYEEIESDGGASYPYVMVHVLLAKHYTDESTEDYKDYFRGVVTYAAGETYGAIIDEDTGVVSIGENTSGGDTNRVVFDVKYMMGTVTITYPNGSYEARAWTWNGSYTVEQQPKFEEEDQKIYLDGVDYRFGSSAGNILATDEYVRVAYSGRKIRQYYWESNPSVILTEEERLTMYMTVSGVSGMTILDKDSDEYYVNVGKNSSDSERTFRIRVYYYDTSLYDETHIVNQAAADVSEYYEAPTLLMPIELEEIGANGSGIEIFAFIEQKKYRYNDVTGEKKYLDPYQASVPVRALGGSAVIGTGFSFNNGVATASSMGRTAYTSGRKVYTLTSVFVDGIGYPNHQISLGTAIEIRQAVNNKYTNDVYLLSVSANPASGIPALGGTSVISYSARIKTETWYDADPSVSTSYMDTSASLSTTIGSIASSVSGSDTTTLTFGAADENKGGERDAIVTLSKGGDSVSCSVTQNAASYNFRIVGDSEKECNAESSVVTFSFESLRNGKVWQPDFSVDSSLASIGNISLSGTTYTVQVNVNANTDSNTRDIVVTATQKQWSGNVSLQTTITQAGAATAVVRTIDAYGMWNNTKTKVQNISAVIMNESGNGVTFSGIKVELRRLSKTQGYNPTAANHVYTASYNGSVYVSANGTATIDIPDITHSRDDSYYYWLWAYATQTTKVTYNEIEEYQPEPI